MAATFDTAAWAAWVDTEMPVYATCPQESGPTDLSEEAFYAVFSVPGIPAGWETIMWAVDDMIGDMLQDLRYGRGSSAYFNGEFARGWAMAKGEA